MILGSSQIAGAEKQFINTMKLLENQHSIYVSVIGKPGPMRTQLREIADNYCESNGGLGRDFWTVIRAIKEIQPDCVITWLYRADVIGGIVSAMKRIPYAISSRNTQWPGDVFWKRMLLKWFAERNCELIISNSIRAMQFHLTLGYTESKFRIIPNAISSAPIRKVRPIRIPITLGLAARPEIGKGHFNAIKAFELLKSKVPGSKLKLIGYGVPAWKSLQKLSSVPDSNIELQDGIPDLNSWFSSIDIFLGLSTMWDSDSNSVLEAIANKVPVICSSVQCIESFENELYVVNPNDPTDVVRKIEMILDENFEGLSSYLESVSDKLKYLRDKDRLALLWDEVIQSLLISRSL